MWTKVEEKLSPYWVSISERTSFRRLHRRGGCWFKAVRMEPVWDLSGLPYNAQCGHCWRTGQEVKSKTGTAKEIEEGPSVDTDDETSSSSSSEGEPSTPKLVQWCSLLCAVVKQASANVKFAGTVNSDG